MTSGSHLGKFAKKNPGLSRKTFSGRSPGGGMAATAVCRRASNSRNSSATPGRQFRHRGDVVAVPPRHAGFQCASWRCKSGLPGRQSRRVELDLRNFLDDRALVGFVAGGVQVHCAHLRASHPDAQVCGGTNVGQLSQPRVEVADHRRHWGDRRGERGQHCTGRHDAQCARQIGLGSDPELVPQLVGEVGVARGGAEFQNGEEVGDRGRVCHPPTLPEPAVVRRAIGWIRGSRITMLRWVEAEVLGQTRRVSAFLFGNRHRLELLAALAEAEDGRVSLTLLAERLGAPASVYYRPVRDLIEVGVVAKLPQAPGERRRWYARIGDEFWAGIRTLLGSVPGLASELS